MTGGILARAAWVLGMATGLIPAEPATASIDQAPEAIAEAVCRPGPPPPCQRPWINADLDRRVALGCPDSSSDFGSGTDPIRAPPRSSLGRDHTNADAPTPGLSTGPQFNSGRGPASNGGCR